MSGHVWRQSVRSPRVQTSLLSLIQQRLLLTMIAKSNATHVGYLMLYCCLIKMPVGRSMPTHEIQPPRSPADCALETYRPMLLQWMLVMVVRLCSSIHLKAAMPAGPISAAAS